MKKGFLIVFLIFLILAGQRIRIKPQKLFISGEAMGSTYTVTLEGAPLSRKDSLRLKEEIESVFSVVSAAVSAYDDRSELSLFNHKIPKDTPFKVSSDLYRLLEASFRLSRESEGLFDITLGPLIDLWGFGKLTVSQVPSPEAIKKALEATGPGVVLLLKNQCIVKKNPDARINLNGIAPGYAVDKIACLLSKKGFRNFIIEAGGEIYASGKCSGKTPWSIGIDTPDPDLLPGQQIFRVLHVTDKGVTTSGNYRRYFKVNGKTYSHLIHPKTGWPVDNEVLSVTVVAANCMTADAMTKPIILMGAEKGLEWARSHGIEAVFITKGKNGTFSVKASSQSLCPDLKLQ